MCGCKSLLVAALGIILNAAAGCGAPDRGGGSSGGDGGGSLQMSCGRGCDRGFVCQANSCALDPTGRWSLRVTSGTVAARKADSTAWDGDSSPPDPKVCLTSNGVRSCTPAVQDTYSPLWNSSFPAVTATALQSGLLVEYLDEDLSFDDPICSGNLAVSAEDFVRGAWGFVCLSGIGRVNAQLLAQ